MTLTTVGFAVLSVTGRAVFCFIAPAWDGIFFYFSPSSTSLALGLLDTVPGLVFFAIYCLLLYKWCVYHFSWHYPISLPKYASQDHNLFCSKAAKDMLEGQSIQVHIFLSDIGSLLLLCDHRYSD